METLLFILTALLLLAMIFSQPFFALNHIPRRWLALVFVIKIGFIFVHQYFHIVYGLNPDPYAMSSDATTIVHTFRENAKTGARLFFDVGIDADVAPIKENLSVWNNNASTYNDNRTLIRIHVLLYPLTQGFYLLQCLWFSFFSFAGWLGFYKVLTQYLHKTPVISHSRVLFLFVCAWPPLLFWTAPCFKETLLIGVAGYFFYAMNIAFSKKNALRLIVALALFFLLLSVKIHYMSMLAPVMVLYFILKRSNIGSASLQAILAATFLLALFLTTEYLFNFSSVIYDKRTDFENMARDSHASSIIKCPPYEPYLMSLFMHAPWALFNALCEPLWPTGNFQRLMTAENLFFFISLAYLFYHQQYNRAYTLISVCLMLFAILGLLLIGYTTPVLGAIIRYRVPFIPLIFAAIAIHYKPNNRSGSEVVR